MGATIHGCINQNITLHYTLQAIKQGNCWKMGWYNGNGFVYFCFYSQACNWKSWILLPQVSMPDKKTKVRKGNITNWQHR